MRLIAIVKHVPAAEARIDAAGGRLRLEGASFALDAMDEYGVEEALRLREEHGGDVVVVALGPARAQAAARAALAMGADRAVHIEHEDEGLDPIRAALAVAEVVRAEAPDLVLVGGKQADWDSAALGPALAEALDWPHSDWTTTVTLRGDAVEVVHDVDDGEETLRLPLPAVVTTQQGLNEPRYPTTPNVMKAKRKPLDAKDLGSLEAGRDDGMPTWPRVDGREVVARPRRHELIDGDPETVVAELVRRLRDEARVL